MSTTDSSSSSSRYPQPLEVPVTTDDVREPLAAFKVACLGLLLCRYSCELSLSTSFDRTMFNKQTNQNRADKNDPKESNIFFYTFANRWRLKQNFNIPVIKIFKKE